MVVWGFFWQVRNKVRLGKVCEGRGNPRRLLGLPYLFVPKGSESLPSYYRFPLRIGMTSKPSMHISKTLFSAFVIPRLL